MMTKDKKITPITFCYWCNFVKLSLLLLFIQPIYVLSIEQKPYKCSPKVLEALDKIVPKDKEILKAFFQSLFSSGDFAYTLFGNKPMASIDHSFQYAFFPETKKKLRNKAIYDVQGWRVWRKYSHLFPISQFYFIGFQSGYFFYTTLISKKRTEALIEENSLLFKEFSQSGDTISAIIQAANSINKANDSQLPEHYFQCMGILYGYGKKNAEFYAKDAQFRDMLKLAPFDLKKYSSNYNEYLQDINLGQDNNHLPHKIYHPQVKEMVSHLDQRSKNYGPIKTTRKKNPLSPISATGFMAVTNDKHAEDMKTSHDALKELLVQIYYSDKFLEIVLTKLTSAD